jgi:hypothetical protein
MGKFGAELRPIGLVFPSWKLNLASFGLEIVQAPSGTRPRSTKNISTA